MSVNVMQMGMENMKLHMQEKLAEFSRISRNKHTPAAANSETNCLTGTGGDGSDDEEA